MSVIDRTDRCTAPVGGTSASAIAGPIDRANIYLTDEVFLYRTVRFIASDGGIVELEDCYGLDIVCVPERELRARQLRLVTPTPVESRGRF